MAIPKFVIDLPCGGGKVPMLPPDYVLDINEREIIVRNFNDEVYSYPQPEVEKAHKGG